MGHTMSLSFYFFRPPWCSFHNTHSLAQEKLPVVGVATDFMHQRCICLYLYWFQVFIYDWLVNCKMIIQSLLDLSADHSNIVSVVLVASQQVLSFSKTYILIVWKWEEENSLHKQNPSRWEKSYWQSNRPAGKIMRGELLHKQNKIWQGRAWQEKSCYGKNSVAAMVKIYVIMKKLLLKTGKHRNI